MGARVRLEQLLWKISWPYRIRPSAPPPGTSAADAVVSKPIEVLSSPSQMYDHLLHLAQRSTRRITLSSLYIGTGDKELKLVDAIARRQVKTTFLLDYTRGTRGEEGTEPTHLDAIISDVQPRSSLDLLRRVKAMEERTPNHSGVTAALFRSPELATMFARAVQYVHTHTRAHTPFLEVIGLQHMKLYIFDNTVVLSGANLSDDYFTNRQDRAISITNAELADDLCSFADILASSSYQLERSSDIDAKPPTKFPDPMADPTSFKTVMRKVMERYFDDCRERRRKAFLADPAQPGDTLVYPLFQFGPIHLKQDEQCMTQMLASFAEGERVHLASGYFNLTDEYMDAILSSKADFDILAASPQANGFLGAGGLKGRIPTVYTVLEHDFMKHSLSRNAHGAVSLAEWMKQGWTFHAKGLWVTAPNETDPFMTLIGSSNYGHRSCDRDLEAQFVMTTSDEDLRRQLAKERDELFEKGTPVSIETLERPERRPGWIERLITPLIRSFF